MTRELLYRSVYDQIDTKKTGFITQVDLVKASSKGRRGSIAKVFGERATTQAIQAFQTMDTDGEGKVTWSQFFKRCEEAFVHEPEKRVNAPRRPSLLAAAPKPRRPSYIAPPSMAGIKE